MKMVMFILLKSVNVESTEVILRRLMILIKISICSILSNKSGNTGTITVIPSTAKEELSIPVIHLSVHFRVKVEFGIHKNRKKLKHVISLFI